MNHPHATPRALRGLLLLVCSGCSHADVVRINPQLEGIEQWRITCKEEFARCEYAAKKLCRDYTELERKATNDELKPVEGGGLSRTGPTYGDQRWRGTIVVQCGDAPPPIRLVRNPTPPAPVQPTEQRSTAPRSIPKSELGLLCIPGETQACLGPGACSGAQACLPDASGYGVCDCGPREPTVQPPTTIAEPGAGAAPTAPATNAPLPPAQPAAQPPPPPASP